MTLIIIAGVATIGIFLIGVAIGAARLDDEQD